ncbi:MAG: acyltransferase family protein [Solirubrobacteraceae bacterium]
MATVAPPAGGVPAPAPPAVAPPPGHPRFPHVDAVRALAALAVVAVHVAAFSGVTDSAAAGAFTARLDVGVAIFFCLSGFLLYRPYVVAAAGGRAAARAGVYARRRALRILPAYWFALAVLALWPGLNFTGGWWRYAGFLQAYDANTTLGGIPPAWTLCVEVTFYALLPLYALALRRARGSVRAELAVLAALSLAALAFRTALHHDGAAHTVEGTLPGLFGWFAVGMALAVLSVAGRVPARAPWAWWAGAAALFCLVSVGIGAPRVYDERAWSGGAWLAAHVLYAAIAACIVIPAIAASDDRGPRRILRGRALGWLGLVSYGIFLWHYTLLAELHAHGVHGWVALAALGLPLTLACAAVSYHLVERPLLARK